MKKEVETKQEKVTEPSEITIEDLSVLHELIKHNRKFIFTKTSRRVSIEAC